MSTVVVVVVVVVAVIAAVASLGSAWVSWRSAKRATTTADGMDRRRHIIEAHDREAEEFRRQYAEMMTSWGDVRELLAMSSAIMRSEIVRSHPLCTPALADAINLAMAGYMRLMRDPNEPHDDFDSAMDAARAEVRAIHARLAAKRAKLIETLGKKQKKS